MKIEVKNLRPNPFRKIKRYPINQEKLKALKTSIKETTFWDNILARPCPTDGKGFYKVTDGDDVYVGNFDINGKAIEIIDGGNPVEWTWQGKVEILYGHHRLMALKELGIKEIDIPVRSFDDAAMIKIMANENMEVWGLNTAVVNETILVAKEFLEAELSKHETWDTSGKYTKGLFINQRSFETAKGMGIGRDTILKFLGGNWKSWMVREALDTLALHKSGVIDRKTIETLPRMTQAQVFKKSVQDYNVPKTEQKRLAKKIVTEDIGSRDIPKTIRDAAPKYEKSAQDPEVERLKNELEKIRSKANSLYVTILGFNLDMQKLKVKQVKGVQAFFTTDAIADLLPAVKKLLTLFGFDFEQLLLTGKSDES